MRGEFHSLEHREFNYSTARGLFFDGNEAYVLEVYDGGRNDELGVKLYNGEESFQDIILNQPTLHSEGVNESLSITSEEAELPETDEDIEAYARFVLQETVDEAIQYEGPRDLEDLEY